MNSKDALKIEEDKIRSQEPEILIMYTAEMQRRDMIRGRKLKAADKIARAIMHISSLYGQAVKKVRGGWSCGTHMNHVRTAVSYKISSEYNDEQLFRFIDFCVNCADSRESLLDAGNDIKDMVEDFLSIRPAPLVHLPVSWRRQVLESED